MSVSEHILNPPPHTFPAARRNRWPEPLFGVLVAFGGLYVLGRYGAMMDEYERGILVGTAVALTWLADRFPALRTLVIVVTGVSLLAVRLYGADLTRADSSFLLKYLLASQSAIMWMSALFVMATVAYFVHLLSRSAYAGSVATGLTWTAVAAGAYLLRDWRARVNPAGVLATRLPDLDLLDDLVYKAIALGFAFFTLATILGALWAAEAWGGYWSWDPKETWTLIVWLNYAGWLHLRIARGWRGRVMAWWALLGLFVTLFAFLGVNMWLSGLHSYGEL